MVLSVYIINLVIIGFLPFFRAAFFLRNGAKFGGAVVVEFHKNVTFEDITVEDNSGSALFF